jgi:hypothetical protein
MVKKFKYIPLEEKTHQRFKQIKNFFQATTGEEYSISEFLDYLLDLLKPQRLPNQ